MEAQAGKFGSPGKPVYGYAMKLFDENTGAELTGAGQKGVVAIEGPPGCMQTVWGDDERFVQTYWKSIPNRQVYSTFDCGIRDEDGFFFIPGAQKTPLRCGSFWDRTTRPDELASAG